MASDLTRLLDVRELGGRAVDAIELIVGAGGAPSPVLAAVLHSSSSVVMGANSPRLIRHELT